MKIIAFDTSASATSVALLMPDGTVLSRHEIAPAQQARRLLPLIDELLEHAGYKLADLDAIAFGCGPGSFTGIRIASSVAQGLAFAHHTPVIAISSLAALAQTAADLHGWQNILVAVDARMQAIYAGVFQCDAHGEVILSGEEILCSPSAFPLPLQNNIIWHGIGSGWSSAIPMTPSFIDDDSLADARAILKLAQCKLLLGHVQYAQDIRPIYLRDQVAKRSDIFPG